MGVRQSKQVGRGFATIKIASLDKFREISPLGKILTNLCRVKEREGGVGVSNSRVTCRHFNNDNRKKKMSRLSKVNCIYPIANFYIFLSLTMPYDDNNCC